jgi:hypothetical protein
MGTGAAISPAYEVAAKPLRMVAARTRVRMVLFMEISPWVPGALRVI